MGYVKCAECGEETKDEDVFRHQGKPYCPKCTVKHLKDEHHKEIMKSKTETRALEEAEKTRTKAKFSSEGSRAYTYKDT
jgi:NAD-dependent SIR2 family protein deacetylase